MAAQELVAGLPMCRANSTYFVQKELWPSPKQMCKMRTQNSGPGRVEMMSLALEV